MTVYIPGYPATCPLYSVDCIFAYVVQTCLARSQYWSVGLIAITHLSSIILQITITADRNHHSWSRWTLIFDRHSISRSILIIDLRSRSLLHLIADRISNLDHPRIHDLGTVIFEVVWYSTLVLWYSILLSWKSILVLWCSILVSRSLTANKSFSTIRRSLGSLLSDHSIFPGSALPHKRYKQNFWTRSVCTCNYPVRSTWVLNWWCN